MKNIPYIYKNIHTHTIDTSRVLYNPLSRKGITVVNGLALKTYQLIDGKKTTEDIYYQLKKEDLKLTLVDILSVFNILIEYKIVYLNKEPELDLKELTKKNDVLIVWFHVTNQCNLRCKYCFIWKTSEEMSKEVGEAAIRNLIQSAKKGGFKYIRLNYAGGEPLLKIALVKHFTAYAQKHAKKNNIIAQFGVVTNGVLITEDVGAFLKKNKIIVTITVDGTEKEHNLQRPFANGLGSYSYVKKGIEILKKHKVPFVVNIVITKNNIKNLPNHIAGLIKDNIEFQTLFLKVNPFSTDGLRASDEEFISTLKTTYENIRKDVPSHKVINGLLDYVVLKPALLKCRAGKETIAVNWNGIISPCALIMDHKTGDSSKKNPLQKLKNPGIPSVHEISGCRTCKWKYICGAGCASETYFAYGKFASKTPYCRVYKTLIPEIIDLEARRIMKYDHA